MQYKAALVDFDGTLADSMPWWLDLPRQTLIEEGGQFRFKIETLNGYQFDQTTRIKVFPAKTYYADVINDTVDAEYGVVLTPDEEGFYTIDRVNEDLVVEAFNLDAGSFPWLKTFLMDMFNFFKRLAQWFFGLRKN